MFTGFASENTPAIQVWDFVATYSGTANISLMDDCAPIQYFKTGAFGDAINIYLPTSPIEGKQLKIVNARFGNNNANLVLRASDVSSFGTGAIIYTIGAGQSIDLCYSKNTITSTVGVPGRPSGWISLNQGAVASLAPSSVVMGGSGNSIAESYSAIAGGQSNSINVGNAFVGGGSGHAVNGSSSAIIGGENGSAGGFQCAVIAGSSCSAGGSYAVAVGGDQNAANSGYSVVVGGARGTARSIVGNTVFSASSSPVAYTIGGSQTALLVLGRQTTNATATRLTSDISSAGTTNQVILPNNSAYVFEGTCIANVTGASTTSGWKFEGVIKRGANAASTTLVAAVTPTVIAQDVAAATWVLAITADTTNGGIAVTVTGAAATTIRWVSRIETTEVTF